MFAISYSPARAPLHPSPCAREERSDARAMLQNIANTNLAENVSSQSNWKIQCILHCKLYTIYAATPRWTDTDMVYKKLILRKQCYIPMFCTRYLHLLLSSLDNTFHPLYIKKHKYYWPEPSQAKQGAAQDARKYASGRPAPLVSIQVCNPDVSSRALGGKPHKTTQSDTPGSCLAISHSRARARLRDIARSC